MNVICLGTSGYQPSDVRHTSCYFIPDLGLMLDAGTGCFRARKLLTTSSLDILLTHAHLDHVIGLTYFLGWRELAGLEEIRVFGAPRTLEQVRQHLFSEALFPVVPPIQWHPLPTGQGILELRPSTFVRWWEQTHPGGSLGFRVDHADHSLAYVTDTTASASDPYEGYLQDVHLLIHECNFDDRQQGLAAVTGHSWFGEVLQRAARCSVKKLALVHTNPYDDEQKSLFSQGSSKFRGEMCVPNDLDELFF